MSKEKQNLTLIKLKNFYKKNSIMFIVLIVLIVLGTIALSIGNGSSNSNENKVFGDDVIFMHYFHLTTCKYCHAQNKFMEETLFNMFPNLKVIEYEMTKDGSIEKYIEFANKIEGLDPARFPGTPLTIIGNEFNSGFGGAETSGQNLIQLIQVEQDRIDDNWDESTMTRTVDIKTQNE